MTEVLNNLNDNLKQQVALYEEFNTQEKEKQNALLQNNLLELEAITAREEQLSRKVNQLEKERLVWAEKMGSFLGKAPEELTLAELAKQFPVLQEVRFELDRAVGSLQEIHKINVQLLQQAMKIVQFTIGMFTHCERTTYTHPRRKENEGNLNLNLLDRRI